MLAHTSQFKEELFKFGRQYKNKIGFYGNSILSTEAGDLITTESNDDIIGRVSNTVIDYEIDDINIYSIKLITKGELLSTLMKELDFESDLDLEIGKVFNYQFGILVGDDYEYLNYGKFIIYKKEYKDDTKTYLYTCYDLMLKSMRSIGKEFEFDSIPTGLQVLVEICNNIGYDFNTNLVEQDGTTPTPLGMIKSLAYSIDTSIIDESNVTYRDLLNTLCQYFGVSMVISGNELKIKLLGNIVNDNGVWVVDNENITSVDTIDETPFKDKNVAFKSLYGRINAINISGTDGAKTVYLQDNQSVSDDGLTLFEIKNNILLNNDSFWSSYSQNIAQNVFDLINGVSFNLCDFSTYGIMYLEWLDYYTVNINNKTYKGLLLNSEITIKSGINENIYTELPEKNISEYTTSKTTTTDVIADTLRATGNAYANGQKLVQENELNKELNNIDKKIDNTTDYSSTEKIIGKWIDDKLIYRKVINTTSPSTANSDKAIVNISNIENVINLTGFIKNNTTIFPINSDSQDANYYSCTYYKISGEAIRCKVGANFVSLPMTIIIEYTKAND